MRLVGFPGLTVFHFLWGSFSFISLIMPMLSHTMPESDQEVQERVKEVFGFTPCLWQICVVHAILTSDDMITITKTGSGKSMTFSLFGLLFASSFLQGLLWHSHLFFDI